MSDGKVDTVRSVYEAFLKGDAAGVLGAVSDDVVWSVPGTDPTAGTYRGKAGVGSFLQKLNETFEMFAFEPRHYLSDDKDGVAVLGFMGMKARKTGKKLESEWCHSWTVRDGKVTGYKEYVDTEAVSASLV